MKNSTLRLLSYGIMAYMLIALGWWSILLFSKNQDAYAARTQLLKITLVAQGEVKNDYEFRATPAYAELHQEYQHQKLMILGETLLLVVTLFIGIWFVNEGYNKVIAATRERRNFLLSITHELKSPIAGIRLVLETFRKRELNRNQQEMLLGNALKETHRLQALVNDLLLSARLDQGYQPTLEPINLVVLLEEIITTLEIKYPEADITLTHDADMPPTLGDRAGLSSVAYNLLENAIKYSPNPARVHTSVHLRAGRIHWTVADEGYGIPALERVKIFDKFYRVGSEDTRKTKGTGLGLYIVQSIINAHEGQISVHDNDPHGTRFELQLPFRKVGGTALAEKSMPYDAHSAS